MACQARTNVQSWPEARQSFQQTNECLREHDSRVSDVESQLSNLVGGTVAAGVTEIFFEAYLRATSGVVYARLWDVSTSSAVRDGQISTANSTLSLIRGTSNLTLDSGKVYRAQFGKGGADAGSIMGARTVAVLAT